MKTLTLFATTIRTPRLSVALPLLLAWSFNAEAADVASEWLGTSDQLWGTGSNWDPATVPNNGADTFDVTFRAALATPVLANGTFTVRSVTVGNASTLEIENGRTLNITGLIDNGGTISPTSSGSITSLSISGAIDNTVSFGGSGAIVLDAATDRILGSIGHILVNESPHAIRGAGVVSANFIDLVNRGTITADDPAGVLIIDPRTTLDNEGGTLSATAGGTLRLLAGAYNSTGAGRLLVADDSTIELSSAAIVSSPLDADDQDGDITNNLIAVTASSSLSDVTNNAAISIGNNSTLTIGEGGLTNHGIVTADSTVGTTSLSIGGGGIDNAMTIGGTGSILLDAPNERIIGAIAHTLINDSAHTIRGSGQVGANFIHLVNRGTLTADDPAGVLIIDPRTTLDNEGGTLSAAAGGTLRLLTGNYTSTDMGRFLVADDSTIVLAGAAIVSSPLDADDPDGDIANNLIAVTSSSSLSDVTNNAAISIGNNSTLTVGEGGLTNHGIVTADSTVGTTSLSIVGGGIDNAMTIGGTGSILLDTPTERILGAIDHTLINDSAHTIRGSGQVGVNFIHLVNRGTLTADDPAGALIIDPRTTLDNEGGTLSAAAGGTLRLLTGTYTSTDMGRFLVADNSTIELAGAAIVSSTLDADDPDGDIANNLIAVTASSSLSDVTNNAAISIGNNSTLTVGEGGLTNHGTVTADSTGSTTNLSISGGVDNTVTIGGTGSILLDAPTERIIGTTNHTLINDSPHTIRGAGNVGVNLIELVNRGTIVADIESATLNIDDRTDGMVNEGSLSATGGGILNLADLLAQDAGALTVDAASTATINGAVTHSDGIATIDGTLTATAYNVSAGTLTGSGTLMAPLSTSGPAAVRPSGVLDVTGTAMLGGATTFSSSIASLAQADQLHSTGEFTLTDASLIVTFTGTPGSLTAAETVTIASSEVALGGTFSNAPDMTRITSPNNLASFEVVYTPTAVTLTGVDHAPTFADPTTFSIAETASIGAVVGTLAATDIEGGTIAYSLDSAMPFTVDSASGQITTAAPLDFETQSQYTLTATASDGALTRDTTITIEVTNVLEDNREVVAHYLTRPGGPFEGETDPSIIGIAADPDGDRRANIFELWLGSDPASADSSPAEPNVKIISDAGSDFGAVEISVVAELDDLLAIGAEATFDLATWRSATSSRTVLSEGGGRRTVEFTDPAALPLSNPRFHCRFTADPDSPNPSL